MLKLESVKVSYGAIQAVKGVSLEVRAGEVVTIIGANGAGKSTLLKSIVGLEPVAAGRVLIDGKDCTTVPAHTRVGLGVALSPEGRGVFADQTVRENLMLGAYSRKNGRAADRSGDRARVQALPASEGAPGPAVRNPVGRRAADARDRARPDERAALAAARRTVARPGAADHQGHLHSDPRSCARSGLTILLVEQMAKQALGVADRAYVLETGRITHQGSGRELLNDPKVKAAYLGTH